MNSQRRLGLLVVLFAITGCGGSAGGVDIFDAVERDDVAAIKTFLDAGGDLNVQNFDDSTPLWVALTKKNLAAYEALLKYGADPNIIMSGKRVVTHWAAWEEDSTWLRLALEHGADPNLVNVGSGRPSEGPPLKMAIGVSLENVKLLVEHGADINKPDRFGCTPLARAAETNYFDVVLYLLDQGADYNRSKCSGIAFLTIISQKREFDGKFWRREDIRAQLDAIQAWLDERE